MPDTCWVTAEIGEMHVSRGHCYMELVEKSATDNQLVARMRAVIWAGANARLQTYFSAVTGCRLAVGMQVLLQVEVSFHEVYGISLVVTDIDPVYTLGGVERQKQEVMDRLQREGVWDINRSICLPEVIQRVAVVASATSAGYGDFMNHLTKEHGRLRFDVTLFPAVVQGQEAPRSVCEALDRINACAADFDVAVIIRGGGAQSDLHCFNTYEIAAAVAQFPLPVLTGIGHDRDTTITDMVAAAALKTPTAVADFVAAGAEEFVMRLDEMDERMTGFLAHFFTSEKERLERVALRAVPAAGRRLQQARRQLEALPYRLQSAVRSVSLSQHHALDLLAGRLDRAPRIRLDRAAQTLQMAETKLRLLHPDRVLERGYAMVRVNGKVVSRIGALSPGDRFLVEMADGAALSQVIEKQQKNIQDGE